MLPQVSGIYLIYNTVSGKGYVGSSQDIGNRLCEHLKLLKRNNHHCKPLQNAWNMYGSSAFEFRLIEEVSQEYLLDAEQSYLDYADWGTLYNIARHAESPMKGRKASAETRLKQSLVRSGKNNPWYGVKGVDNPLYGRKRSPEAIEKTAQGLRGKPKSEEHKRKLSEIGKTKVGELSNTWGWVPTEETRRNISNSLKGKPSKRKGVGGGDSKLSQKYVVTSPEGVEQIVTGITFFCQQNGLDGSTMCKVAKGKLKHHRGWKCKYYVD